VVSLVYFFPFCFNAPRKIWQSCRGHFGVGLFSGLIGKQLSQRAEGEGSSLAASWRSGGQTNHVQNAASDRLFVVPVASQVHITTRDRFYDSKNIFAKKIGERNSSFAQTTY
jgi:hypothetical protein